MSRSTIKRRIAAGQLPTARDGGAVRVHRDDVTAYADRLRNAS